MRPTPRRAVSCLGLALVVCGVAQAGSPPQADSEVERWLALVGPLATESERDAYLGLTRPYQRRAFEERFWQVRDPYPETAANEFAAGWLERAPAALERWSSLDDARALATTAIGEPVRRLRVTCAELVRPLEIWTFGAAARLRSGFVAAFVAEGFTADSRFRGWSPREGVLSLATSAGAAMTTAEQLLERIARECPHGTEAASLLLAAIDWPELVARGGLLPAANPEWLRTFTALSTEVPEGADELAAELEIRFPGRRGSRTLVEGLLRLAHPPAIDTTLHVDGEVLRDEQLFEHFRYRYRAKADDAVPFVFERPLRPGSYRLVVRLHDVGADRYYRVEHVLEVPATARPGGTVSAPVETSIGALDGEDEPSPSASSSAIRVAVAGDTLLTGKTRVAAIVRGDAVASVCFTLDGKPVLTKRRPPFGVELDLGRAPRQHRIGALALDAEGREVARDEALVNGGPHRFALRLVEPQEIPRGAERVVARAEVDLPEGEALHRVEFFVNDSLHATLYQKPYVQSLPIPPGAEVAWVRAVAHLSGGGAAEDYRLVGGTDGSTGVDVDFVELYTTALDRRGRPVDDLTIDEVRVSEAGREQTVRRFEHVADLPMHAAVLLDTSTSMTEELDEAESAALRFFRDVLTDRDRAAVLTFADEPRVAVRFTRDLEVLAGGLADLEAFGDTRLWDAVAFALHYFSGMRGKRALVLISDGVDSGSRFEYEAIVEYARRTGVAIYVVGLNVPQRPVEPGMFLDRLARETGGRSFRISHSRELGPVYRHIGQELRAQYLIAYQSSGETSDEFRELEVRSARRGVELRTIRGYYP